MSMHGPLAGRRVLIVEDRYLIASDMAEVVRRLGAEVVGPSPSVALAIEILGLEPVDLALLDVNLDGEMVYPVADQLTEKGVPFIFLTGYDGEVLPHVWRGRPRLEKPLDPRQLRAALMTAAPAAPRRGPDGQAGRSRWLSAPPA